MDSRQYLIGQIKLCRRKMNLAGLADSGILCAAAGGIAAMCCELASFFFPFYYVHLAAGMCFLAGFLAGAGYAVYRRADMRQAAGRIDSFGLKERMLTAYENIDGEDEFIRLQREDAVSHYNQIRGQIRIPLLPDKRHILALLVTAAAVICLGVLPSPVRDQARLRHQVHGQAEEELEELEELLLAMEEVDTKELTEEQRARLEELAGAMELSREELAKADSWESLSTAMQRLNYKYQQTAQGLEQLAGQLRNPDAAGVAGAEAMAKAAADRSGGQQLTSGTAVSSGDGEGTEGNGTAGSGQGSGDGEGTEGNGTAGSGQAGEGTAGTAGNGQAGEGTAGSGQGSGDGEGTEGNGTAGSGMAGEGTAGSGMAGNGQGSGQGRGTGSSNAAHDYVSIPNAVADDPSLTGDKTGDQNSDYYRQQNGLAWEGDHVDYSSVIGEYANSAYEGIANGRYPIGMEPVIRDYFENLSK